VTRLYAARRERDGTQSFAPTQLKEVPPAVLNPAASVQGIVNGLAKYPSSTKLTVAIHLNGSYSRGPCQRPRLNALNIWSSMELRSSATGVSGKTE